MVVMLSSGPLGLDHFKVRNGLTVLKSDMKEIQACNKNKWAAKTREQWIILNPLSIISATLMWKIIIINFVQKNDDLEKARHSSWYN